MIEPELSETPAEDNSDDDDDKYKSPLFKSILEFKKVDLTYPDLPPTRCPNPSVMSPNGPPISPNDVILLNVLVGLGHYKSPMYYLMGFKSEF